MACAANQRVIAGAPFEPVVAAGALETVVTGVTAELIVERGSDKRFDADIEIACGRSALPDARLKVGTDTDIRAFEDHRVETRAAVDRVAAKAAIDNVVAIAGVNMIVAASGLDPVITAKREDIVVACEAPDRLAQSITD